VVPEALLPRLSPRFPLLGAGHVSVTFSPSGRVSEVVVDDAIFSGTPAGRCVISAFANAFVPPFSSGPVKVGKSFTIGLPPR